jgi:dolichol-phosphate mannosyltransferase
VVHAAISLIAPEPPAEAVDEAVDEAAVPLLSIVVPTKNERDNVAALVERLEAALPTVAMEVIFVDDSDDGTRELVHALAEDGHHDLVLVPQAPQRRICGLGAAVLQGMRVARGPWVCVMDADLQHPPELIAALLEQGE